MRRLWARVQGSLPAQLARAYGESNAASYAAALAFGAFLAMFPLILGLLGLVGLFIQDPGTEARVQGLLLQAFPADAQPQLLKALQGVKQSAGWLGLISLAGVLWAGSSLYGSLEFGLTQVFGSRRRNLLRQRFMGLAMMVVFVVAVAAAAVLNGLLALVPGLSLLGVVAAALVLVGLLTLVYRVLPNRALGWRDVLPGAVLAGAAIELLALAWPLYAWASHGFNTYGQGFALFFLLAAWFYFLSQVVLLGAVLNRLLMERRRPPEKVAAGPAGQVPRGRRGPRHSVLAAGLLAGAAAVGAAAGALLGRRRRHPSPRFGGK